jgi:hypothetical protein
MLLTGRVNFGLIQLCLRMVPSYLRDTGIDFVNLFAYPTNADLNSATHIALDEARNL